jgi:hypothetical protein
MSLRSYFKSGLLTATLAVSTSVLASPSLANPDGPVLNFTHLATDQDVYPANYPYSYPAVQTLVLDMTSTGFILQPFPFEFPDLIAERQLTGFRSITREMYDLQTLSDPNIRTRDLPSPYTTALSEFCAYYNVTGAAYPVTGTPNAAECNAPVPVAAMPEPVAPQPVFIPRAAPVPALW